MAYFMIINWDDPEKPDLRAQTRDAHLAYMRGDHGALKLRLAGPCPNPSADGFTGSLVVVEADTQAEAEAFAAADPYTEAGLFVRTDVRAWMWTMGNPDAN